MKTILLPFYEDPAAEQAALQAAKLAHHVDGHIEGLFVTRPPQIIEAEGIALAGAYITQLKDEWQRRAESAKARFETLMAESGVKMATIDTLGSATASWREIEGPEGQIVGDRGRLFDLLVIARTSEQSLIDWQVMCESAFFESGRLSLIASPKTAEGRIGKRVLIHWNRSTEAARTIALSMPYLSEADHVVVLEITGATSPGPSGSELSQHLTRNGISTSFILADLDDRGPGEIILDTALSEDIDLLVKGAYTQNRFRQLIFGGATRHVLAAAHIPILMAH